MSRVGRYAVVPSRGCYGSSETVRAVYTTDDLGRAARESERRTRAYRTDMARYGGTSGGYRVVLSSGAREWSYGHDLDRTPTVEPRS